MLAAVVVCGIYVVIYLLDGSAVSAQDEARRVTAALEYPEG